MARRRRRPRAAAATPAPAAAPAAAHGAARRRRHGQQRRPAPAAVLVQNGQQLPEPRHDGVDDAARPQLRLSGGGRRAAPPNAVVVPARDYGQCDARDATEYAADATTKFATAAVAATTDHATCTDSPSPGTYAAANPRLRRLIRLPVSDPRRPKPRTKPSDLAGFTPEFYGRSRFFV